MARADSAVVLVTARATDDLAHQPRWGGCLVGFFSQVSIDPPMLCVWQSRENAMFALAVKSRHLAVHLVPADRLDLAR